MKLFSTTILLLLFSATAVMANPPVNSNPLNESLIYNVYFGKATDVARLLKKGADPNARDEHQWPALAIASDRNDRESALIAQELLKAGANVNGAFNQNYPIINAIRNNNAPLVKLLLGYEANIRIYDSKGQTPYGIAKREDNAEVLYYIEKLLAEERQLQAYMLSQVHLRQIMERFSFNNCAFQYWSFYLNSKQDKNVKEAEVKGRLQAHANAAQIAGREGLQYFPAIFTNPLSKMTTRTRLAIYNELNGMISNRNRRSHNVGKVSDMLHRCGVITQNELVIYGLKKS